MTLSVHKKQISPRKLETHHYSLQLPKHSELLKVGNQYEQLTFWYLCDPEETELETLDLYIIGTGMEFDESARPLTYIDSVAFNSGRLILHVFRKPDINDF